MTEKIGSFISFLHLNEKASEMIKRWRLLFLSGVLSPLLAVAIKPLDYGFYMFIPATPNSILDRTRLFVADSILVIGFLICVLVSVRAVFVTIKSRKPYYLLIPVVVFFHPLLQPVFLERADTTLNRRWGSKARELQVVGRSEKEVRSLLGSPTHVTEESGYLCWEYKPLPIYWFGSKGQVSFVDGVVRSIDVNDD